MYKFWIKFLMFGPEFLVVVDEMDGQLDCHSLRSGHSIDFNGLLSKT